MHQLFSGSSEWIWLDNTTETNCYVEFSDAFATEVSDEGITLLISVEGQYAVFFNGQYLPSTQYPDYPFYKAVQTVEINKVDTNAPNELVIQTLYCGVDTHTTRREKPGIRFEVWQGDRLLCASGTQTRARLMSGYQNGQIRNITPQLGPGFVYRNCAEGPWNRAVAVEKRM